MSDPKTVPTMGAPDASDAVYDARTLGAPKMTVFGIQHMFAMFGATILVPTLTGLSVSATLLFAGLGTLLFHFLAKGKVPAFLGSSFAFIAGYAAIAPNGEAHLLPYACQNKPDADDDGARDHRRKEPHDALRTERLEQRRHHQVQKPRAGHAQASIG